MSERSIGTRYFVLWAITGKLDEPGAIYLNAKEIGIEDGDMVKVITPFADGTFKAKIRGIARHAIHIPHGGGNAYMAEPWKNGNVNDLCSLDYADPMTGFVLIKSVPCRVEKV